MYKQLVYTLYCTPQKRGGTMSESIRDCSRKVDQVLIYDQLQSSIENGIQIWYNYE